MANPASKAEDANRVLIPRILMTPLRCLRCLLLCGMPFCRKDERGNCSHYKGLSPPVDSCTSIGLSSIYPYASYSRGRHQPRLSNKGHRELARRLARQQGVFHSRLYVVLAPGPIHAEIGVVFRLPGDGVAVGEEQLHGVALEVVVADGVDHG